MAPATSELSILIKAKDQASGTFKNVQKEATGFGTALGKIGTIAGGVFAGAVLTGGVQKLTGFLTESVKAAADEEAAIARLKQAVDNTGVSYDAYADQLDNAIEKAQDMAFTDDQARSALALLMAQTGNAEDAMRRFALAQDVARGANIDLETASRLLGRVTEENAQVFKRMGINLQEGATATQAFGELQEKFGGQATTFAESTGGAMERVKIQMGELQETIGYLLLPAIGKIADVAADSLPKLSAKIEEVRADFSEWAASPEGQEIIAEVREIGQTFLETMRAIGTIVQETVRTVREHWKQIKPIFDQTIQPLMGIMNAIKLVAAVMRGDWGAALDAMKAAAANFVTGALGPFKAAWGLLEAPLRTVWQNIRGGVETMVNGIITALNAALGALETVLNGMINAYNETIGRIPFGPGKINTLNLEIPKIDLSGVEAATDAFSEMRDEQLATKAATEAAADAINTSTYDLGKFANLSDAAAASTEDLAAAAGGDGGGAGAAFRGLDADLAALRETMRSTAESGLAALSAEIAKEEDYIAGLTSYLDQAQAAHDDLTASIQETTDAMTAWDNAVLEGTDAYSDAAFAFDQSMKGIQAEINKLELKKLLDPNLTAGQVKVIDSQIRDLEDELEILRLKAEGVDLAESLELDPLRRQLDDLMHPVEEFSFDEIVAGWKGSSEELADYLVLLARNEEYMAKVQASMAEHQTILDNLQAAYTELGAALDAVDPAIKAIWEARGGGVISSIEEAFAAIDRGDKAAAETAMADAQALFDRIKALVPGAETGLFAPIEKVLKDAQGSINVDIGKMADDVGEDVTKVGVTVQKSTGDILTVMKDSVVFYLESIRNRLDIINETLTSIPSAQHGGAVLKPGLVGVHAGETIVPKGASVGGDVSLNVAFTGPVMGDQRQANEFARKLIPFLRPYIR